MAHLSRLRVNGSVRSSRANSWVRLTLLVQFARILKRATSETIRSSGFSSAKAYSRSCLNTMSKLACLPLYSQTKWCRFQTWAQPSPPRPCAHRARSSSARRLGRRRLALASRASSTGRRSAPGKRSAPSVLMLATWRQTQPGSWRLSSMDRFWRSIRLMIACQLDGALEPPLLVVANLATVELAAVLGGSVGGLAGI